MDDVIAVVADLFFEARIRAAARAAGRQVRVARRLEDLGPDGFALALIELEAPLDVPETVRRLKARGPGPVIVFGPHLDTERRKEARQAGADRILAKSKLVTELPRIMGERSGGADDLEQNDSGAASG